MTQTEMPAPDPNDAEAAALAEKLRARQSLLRGRAAAYPTSPAEAAWLTLYALAEARMRRDERETERRDRRSRH